MISLFATNPFYVFGIPATTDQRSIRRIIEERGIQLQLGLNSGGLTQELLRSFRQTIETPRLRATAELFGFHLADPSAPTEHLALLRERAQGANGLERTLLFHDVALAAHLAWALTEVASPAGVEALRISLSAWRPVLREPGFCEYVAERSDKASSGEELWQECAKALVQSVAEVAASFLFTKKLGSAVALVGVLRDAALPGDAIDKALRDITRDTRGEIATAIQRIGPRNEGTIDDARLDEIVLINEILGPQRRLALLGFSQTNPDELAGAIRTVSIQIYNRAQDPFVAVALLDAGLTVLDAPRLVSAFAADRATVLRQHHQERAVTAWQANQWAAAAAHATLAADVSNAEEVERFRTIAARAAASSSPKEVADWARRAQAPFDAERLATSRRIEAAAHFESWSGEGRAYTDPSGYDFGAPVSAAAPRAGTAAAAARQSQRSRWIFAAIAAGLLLLAWANGSFAGSSGTRATSTPFQRATPTTAPCVSSLATMKADITSAKTRLSSMESDLSAIEQRVTSLKRSIESTEATYPRGIPSSIYPSYSAQIDDYNRLLSQYKAQYNDYDALFTQTDAAVSRYNALLATCR